ncbi:MAG: hypothetical protein AB2665_13470 [Candidatus Thiodiazotropha sp.]
MKVETLLDPGPVEPVDKSIPQTKFVTEQPLKVDLPQTPANNIPAEELFLPSGIDPYDRRFGGLVLNSLNLFQTSDYESGIAALGSFITNGLINGERVTLASFQHPKHLLYKLSLYGFSDLDTYLENEQLVYLYYKPFFEKSLSLSLDYGRMFDEITKISSCGIKRVALDNCEALFNKQSHQLAKSSAIKLLLAAERREFTTLGTFVNERIDSDNDLDKVCSSTMTSFTKIDKQVVQQKDLYRFLVEKSPNICFNNAMIIELKVGHGFVRV